MLRMSGHVTQLASNPADRALGEALIFFSQELRSVLQIADGGV